MQTPNFPSVCADKEEGKCHLMATGTHPEVRRTTRRTASQSKAYLSRTYLKIDLLLTPAKILSCVSHENFWQDISQIVRRE